MPTHHDHHPCGACLDENREISALRETVRFLNDRVREQDAELIHCRERMQRASTTILALDDRVRVLEAGEAEAREFVEYVEGLCGAKACTPGDCVSAAAREWLAVHPAPKETP